MQQQTVSIRVIAQVVSDMDQEITKQLQERTRRFREQEEAQELKKNNDEPLASPKVDLDLTLLSSDDDLDSEVEQVQFHSSDEVVDLEESEDFDLNESEKKNPSKASVWAAKITKQGGTSMVWRMLYLEQCAKLGFLSCESGVQKIENALGSEPHLSVMKVCGAAGLLKMTAEEAVVQLPLGSFIKYMNNQIVCVGRNMEGVGKVESRYKDDASKKRKTQEAALYLRWKKLRKYPIVALRLSKAFGGKFSLSDTDIENKKNQCKDFSQQKISQQYDFLIDSDNENDENIQNIDQNTPESTIEYSDDLPIVPQKSKNIKSKKSKRKYAIYSNSSFQVDSLVPPPNKRRKLNKKSKSSMKKMKTLISSPHYPSKMPPTLFENEQMLTVQSQPLTKTKTKNSSVNDAHYRNSTPEYLRDTSQNDSNDDDEKESTTSVGIIKNMSLLTCSPISHAPSHSHSHSKKSKTKSKSKSNGQNIFGISKPVNKRPQKYRKHASIHPKKTKNDKQKIKQATKLHKQTMNNVQMWKMSNIVQKTFGHLSGSKVVETMNKNNEKLVDGVTNTMEKVTDTIHTRQDALEQRIVQNESSMNDRLQKIEQTLHIILETIANNQ